MERCPRCGDLVDGLQQLPAESLRDEVGGDTGNRASVGGRACSWWRHELLEG